jgi:hypothetical protein
MCGSRLVFSDPPIDSSAQSSSDPFRQTQEISPLPASTPDPVPSFGSLSLFATAPTSKETDPHSGPEVQWLQEKNYDSDLDEGSQRSSATKYLVTALGLMLLGVLFYAQWTPQKSHPAAANSAGTAHPAAVNQPPESRASEPAATQPATEPAAANEAAPANEAASKPSTQTPPRETAQNEQNPRANNPPPAGPPPAVPNTEPAPVRNASTVQSEDETPSSAGAEELAQAEGYLTGKYGSRNSSEAARYLWKAVSKENPTAILLLSDLYLAGDGVPKSCAQAQLLLRAAARKNIAAAANKLRELQQTGCP